MTRIGLIASTLAVLLLATAVEAWPKDKAGPKGNGHSASVNCPPGLAKKNPPCIPSGQVGKGAVIDHDANSGIRWREDYAVGVPLPNDYVIMFDPSTSPFWPHAAYARYGDFLYLIDPATGEILSPGGHLGEWNWPWEQVDFAHCPPGLAKKNPPCVPPGQARNGIAAQDYPYRTGDHLPDGYRVIFAPPSQAGMDNALYARLGNSLYRVDRNTGLVLNLIGTIADLLR